jgi:Ca2+-binding RTX toxin-like protein
VENFKRTREWVTAYDPTTSGNQIYVQGSELDDLLVDHDSTDWWESDGTQLYGYSGNDTLTGGSGNDWLVGAEGDDLLQGGTGDDVYLYAHGDGHDVIDDVDRSGVIVIEHSTHEGLYTSLAGHQRQLNGGWADDANFDWNGNGGDLGISGRDLGPDGSITIRNFHNGDYGIYLTGATVSGHAKQFGDSYVENTLTGSAGPDKLYGHSLNDVLYGGAGDDELYGADGDDQLNGGEGHDQIFGSYGDNILDGGPGSDQLFGGDGNNILIGGDGNDEIFSLDGADSIYGDEGADEIYSSGGNDIVYGGPGSDLVFGSFGSDRIYGGTGSDILHGGPDNDYLEGGEGADIYTYEAGDGYDTIVDSGSNTLRFGEGIVPSQLTIYEGQSSLYINTGADSDTLEIRGYSAADPRSSSITQFNFHAGGYLSIEDLMLEANRAEPIALTGGELDDYIRGSWLPDKITLGAGDDTVEGSGGPDLLYGNAGNDLLEGGAGDDKLYGGKGDDTLRAGDGNDRLKGGSGDDTLVGGFGNDVLNGGAGNDTYMFALGDGKDSIRNKDSDPGSHDLLEIQSIAHDALWLSRKKDHLIVDVVGTDDRIKLKNWYASPDSQVDVITAGDYSLLADQVDQLVAAMAAFDVPSGAGAVIPDPTRTELEVTLANSWQATA